MRWARVTLLLRQWSWARSVCEEVPAQVSQLHADEFVGWQSPAEEFMESYIEHPELEGACKDH